MDEQQKQNLRDCGISIEPALARFMDKDDMYLKFLKKFLYENKNISGLEAGVEQQDVKSAFACAHSMKGVAANLGLDNVNEKLIPIVEILRKDSLEGVQDRMPGFVGQIERVKAVCEQCGF